MTIVHNEKGTSPRLSAERMAMPVMIPGRARGRTRNTEMPSRPKKWNRPTAAAAIEPKTMATSVATSATSTERRIAAHRSGVSRAWLNHRVVSPGGGKLNALSWVVKA